MSDFTKTLVFIGMLLVFVLASYAADVVGQQPAPPQAQNDAQTEAKSEVPIDTPDHGTCGDRPGGEASGDF